MSIADLHDEPSRTATSPMPLERSLARTNELLVGRTNTPEWWTALARNIDDVAGCVESHAVACESVHRQLLPEHPRLAFRVRALERDHVELIAEAAELRAVVAAATDQAAGLPIVLAATTELVARLRGHDRRAGNLLHEALRQDLGESG